MDLRLAIRRGLENEQKADPAGGVSCRPVLRQLPGASLVLMIAGTRSYDARSRLSGRLGREPVRVDVEHRDRLQELIAAALTWSAPLQGVGTA